MSYDSRPATHEHITEVRKNIGLMILELMSRGVVHDSSKLKSPEVEIFDEFTPKLATIEYGSEEYKEALKAMGPALKHHYSKNSHHPEHYPNGVSGMDLLDVVEMICDWEAAARRTKAGNLHKSLDQNFARFGIDAQLGQIIRNTVAAFWPRESSS